MEKLRWAALMILSAMIFLIAQIAIVLNPEAAEAVPSFLRGYLATHIPYLAVFITIAIGAHLMHSSIKNLISRKIRIGCIAIPAAIYALMLIAMDIIYSGSISPTDVSPGVFAVQAAAVIILTPMQAAAEEIFFRSIPLRIAYGERMPARLAESLPFIIFSGVFFLLPHLGNREVSASASILPLLYYFSWGALAAFLAIASEGFEATAAMHAVNNIHIALFVNYSSSSMMTEALFINSVLPSDIISIIAVYIVFAATFIALKRTGGIKEGFING